jgi:hypothetical protein
VTEKQANRFVLGYIALILTVSAIVQIAWVLGPEHVC